MKSRFEHKDHILHCENMSLAELAKTYRTPLYVYSWSALEDRVRAYQKAFDWCDDLQLKVAIKANSNPLLLKRLYGLGCGADVVSGGEFFLAQKADIPGKDIVFSGTGKTLEELDYAVRRNVGIINVESEHELGLLTELAEKYQKQLTLSLRLSPDVSGDTHPGIQTGGHIHKFGLTFDEASDLAERIASAEGLSLRGLHVHIGSQMMELSPFVRALKRLEDLRTQVSEGSNEIEFLNLGGGVGVTDDENDFERIASFGALIRQAWPEGAPKHLHLEPGRSLFAASGVLLSEVVTHKIKADKHFLILDAAMNDFMRPALYGARHRLDEVREVSGGGKQSYRVVGPVCESQDEFDDDAHLSSELASGDLVALRTTGAYGYSMANTYNGRPRASEVLVDGDVVEEIRKRECFDDFWEDR